MRKTVIYDFDGTLADTLPTHAQFLLDVNKGWGFKKNLPAVKDTSAWKKLVGMPMNEFFRNVGFPDDEIVALDLLYKSSFGNEKRYFPELFPGTVEMLRNLFEHGIPQAIASSNYRRNIMPVLEKNNVGEFFAEVFGKEELGGSKKDFLLRYAKATGIVPELLIYVGDSEGDFRNAKSAGVSFIGVEYGWQINPNDLRFPVAKSPEHLEKLILEFS